MRPSAKVSTSAQRVVLAVATALLLGPALMVVAAIPDLIEVFGSPHTSIFGLVGITYVVCWVLFAVVFVCLGLPAWLISDRTGVQTYSAAAILGFVAAMAAATLFRLVINDTFPGALLGGLRFGLAGAAVGLLVRSIAYRRIR
jgi:hypothetical protein